MSCKPVLLVEDDLDLRTVIVELLNLEGFSVREAENGKVALDIMESIPDHEHPGCIILDLMMPVMDGKTFLREVLKKHPQKLKNTSILIATAKGNPEKDLKDLPIHCELIRKPVNLNELLNAIEKHCRAS